MVGRELQAKCLTDLRDQADWESRRPELRRQFLDMMDFCLEKLPPNTARVFIFREVMDMQTEEICQELKITATNLWVILYRARMMLRKCLEQNWFANAREGSGVARSEPG